MSELTPEYFAGVLAHVNEDHSAELLAACQAGGAVWASHAELCRLDTDGLTVQLSKESRSEEFNFTFPKPATDALEIRQSLIAFMRQGEALVVNSPLTQYNPDALEQIIIGRRSYPLDKLDSRPIPKAMLERCVSAARYAPNHGRTHPFRFVVMTGETAKEALLARYLSVIQKLEMPVSYKKIYTEMVAAAPAWIAIGMTPRIEKPMPEWEELAAVSMAVQNLHLMAEAQGLGGLWLSGRISTHPDLATDFGWSEAPNKLLGLFYMGFVKHALKPRAYPNVEDISTWREA
jgi:nitroreductase